MEPNIFVEFFDQKKKTFFKCTTYSNRLIKQISVSKRINYKLCFIPNVLVCIDAILLFYFNIIKKGVVRPGAFFMDIMKSQPIGRERLKKISKGVSMEIP